MKNIASKVRDILLYCLYKDDEVKDIEDPEANPPEGAIKVEAITLKIAFHPGRIEEKKEEIKEILDHMDLTFHEGEGGGGGYSFLNLCMDKDGNQWADTHLTCEELLVLAIASGMGKFCMPREFWQVMPGGLPYVAFNTTEKEESKEAV